MCASRDGTETAKRMRLARRIVIKLGTSTVTGPSGELCSEKVAPIVRSISSLLKGGRQVVLVSSGAIGLGRGLLGLHPSRLKDVVVKQACAAAGQSLLMEAYKRLFEQHRTKIAQILLTEEDFSNWERYSNLRRTMEKLIGFGVLPIVNENDTVSTAELETFSKGKISRAFSDNDRLAALVMSGLEGDALVLLTSVDGLLRPKEGSVVANVSAAEGGEVIPFVTSITPELKRLAEGPSHNGRGGMITKLEAAGIATDCGGVAVIANGGEKDVLDRLFEGQPVGTMFLPCNRMKGKRRWLAHAAGIRGRVVVDAGAQRAITRGKASLLSTGVLRVEKEFGSMDVVSIMDPDGREFARGIANCSSDLSREKQVLFTRENIVVLQAGK
ncbi:MAG TPA: glutamate 5-kinase [Candidatus Acidoferrum sp.]|nr:glutamate 5-kinase [Candidatus Acidoferrum sp.]